MSDGRDIVERLNDITKNDAILNDRYGQTIATAAAEIVRLRGVLDLVDGRCSVTLKDGRRMTWALYRDWVSRKSITPQARSEE